MVHHDLISSFIDNELTHEQEQEFLISLAANEQVRKAFRSELVLNDIVHKDDAMTAPPREMRVAIFAAIGLGAAATAGASSASAATSGLTGAAQPSIFKVLFATKMNALLTSAALTVSALGGFAVNEALDARQANIQQKDVQPASVSTGSQSTAVPPVTTLQNTASETAQKSSSSAERVIPTHRKKATYKAPSAIDPSSSAVNEPATEPGNVLDTPVNGVGEVGVDPPEVTRTQKK